MWPLNLPARDFLRLPGATSTAWAVFDADWYRATYAGATAHLTGASADAVLAFYFDTGQGLGHSPNILFDEAWHRRTYPGIAALVESGRFPSAFDAWCRGGCYDRSPHWLFDETGYRRRYPDLTDALLARNGLVNGYDHYLWRGGTEGRIGHPLFDPAIYRANLDPAAADVAAADGPFRHCLRRLHAGGPEVRVSACFDPVWYLDQYPDVATEIARGTWHWALEHYLCNDTATAFDPVSAFSEIYYLGRYDDASRMVRRGDTRNGFAHFLRHGVTELRSPSEAVDLRSYAAREDVSRDLAAGIVPDAFMHFLTIGQPAGLLWVPPRDVPVTETQARTLVRRRARALSVLHGRAKLHFATMGVPALSVIMVLHNQFEQTMTALGSLRANHPGDIELILIDSGSTDESRAIQRYVHGAVHFRFETNIGFLAGCNAALQFATGAAVLYLSVAIELAPGAIDAALRRLDTDPRIGAVGGMVIRTHGFVEEAGAIIWRDGSTRRYGRDASPLSPEVNFVRDVEFCSVVFLMTRRALLNELEGLDENLAPTGYADADLCIRMREAGYRVVYDPAVMVHHLGHGDAAEEEIARAHQLFARKHAAWLDRRPASDESAPLFARSADAARKRVLFIEDTVPLRLIGSGFVRSNDILRVMASMDYAVTVYPINGSRFDVASVYADMPDNVEVMHDGSLEDFPGFLTTRRDYYDLVWVARTHNLGTVRAMLEQASFGSGRIPTTVLDTEAIVAVRDAERAVLEGRTYDLGAAICLEFRDGPFCEKIVAVNAAEAAMLRDLGAPDVSVIGHMRTPHPTPRPFERRAGMLFVGAVHRMDSPNYDSLCWFIDEVLPLVEAELRWQTRLTVVGYTGADVSLERFGSHHRVTLRGAVTDLEPLYDQHRVFIAPTRIAAGAPYKVYEAASFGLPVVATELLRRQLGWESGREILTAEATDPAAFARLVVALQRDEALWLRLRDAALERLRSDNNPENYATAISDVLGPSRIVR